jgi:hypothetical protein
MSIKKFSEFAMNEDIVPLGFAISSKPSYYTLASSGIRTGYDMQPVVGPVMDLASNLSDHAIDYENNENPDHTARGYINEALKYVKEKCYETYESKCNESLDESVSVSTDRYKRSHGKNPGGWGSWAFYFDSRGGEPIFTPSAMDYKDAVKWAKEKAKESNKSTVYVGESLNEAETSVDKVLTPADKKKLKSAFENVITGIDKLTFKKDGTIEGRRGYFYRHGQSPQSVADQLKNALNGQGIEIDIIDTYDDYKPWPKDSNFVVVFKLA